VDLERGLLQVRAIEQGAKKTGRARTIPMSARLGAVLDMVKTDPAGRPFPADAYVFGVLGTRVRSVNKGWASLCVNRARARAAVGAGRQIVGGVARRAAGDRSAFSRSATLTPARAGSRPACRWTTSRNCWVTRTSARPIRISTRAGSLQDSIKRFDASRGKSVAKAPPIEHRPDGHEIARESRKTSYTEHSRHVRP
jgi:hypothetical protein